MFISQKGISLLKKLEGCRLVAYLDVRGIPTIGYGPDIHLGMRITQEEADQRFLKSLQNVESAVSQLVKVQINQNQFDALVCFTYNCGEGALRHSTLLRVLNQGAFKAAAKQFLVWNKSGGKIVFGLTKRRQIESDLFSQA
jgi:lysozyme